MQLSLSQRRRPPFHNIRLDAALPTSCVKRPGVEVKGVCDSV